jgi:hypothetical protein
MKIKLLKKVRNRFQIIHMPKGFSNFGETYDYNLFELRDSDSYYFGRFAQLGRKNQDVQFCESSAIFETEKECIDFLKSIIIQQLKKEGYQNSKDKNIKKYHKKVWYI